MKIKLLNIIFPAGYVLLISLLLMPQMCFADYDYIKISDPFLNKIPVAVPVLKSLSQESAAKEIALKASDLVYEALSFTGYFKMIDREAFLEDLQVQGITGPEINFDNWTDIGAELLITGGVTIKDELLQIEFRLFDTFKSELIFGKRYKGRLDDQRKIVHRFCSEMLYRLTGKRGVFESMIAFVSTTTGNKEIFTCEFDGYDVKQVTKTKSLTLFPAWSPDGSSIAYTSYQNDKPEIFIRHLHDGKEKKISFDGINITPVWMPGKNLMGATLSFEGDEEIYLLTETGKIDKRLTKNWGIDVSPAFSPDGKKMAFVSKRFGSPQIFIQNLDTGAVRRLTYEGKYNTQPDWSPAGDRIVYSGMEAGQANIFVINADGKDFKQLTIDAGSNESPSWSPDGSLIAFSSTRTGKSRIYVMTASGTDQRTLLTLFGEQTDPAWSSSFKEY
ncbi:MAG: Tol-Pal system beta propeller repeat protein TolB [Desulfobacteraceae bacterium]|jgi:TolB protein|nr:Tol-Pal system beta propeller repeat protein TolB [Desulfobacteraceae bacterium]